MVAEGSAGGGFSLLTLSYFEFCTTYQQYHSNAVKKNTIYTGGDIRRDLCHLGSLMAALTPEPLGRGWRHGASTHRENGLFDVGLPLVLSQDGPCEWAGEVHSRHGQVG